MRAEQAVLGLHGAGVMLALAAALVWPRPGQAALMVPLNGADMRGAIAWAAREKAPLLALDTRRGRVIARIATNVSLARALQEGILPLAARAPGCRPDNKR